MSKKLSVFIRPPYRPADNPPGSWQKLTSFGEAFPEAWQKLGIGEKADAVWLQADASDARLFAAATGYLSTRYPDSPLSATTEELLAADLSRDEPESVHVFLNPRPFLDLSPDFRTRAEELFIDPLNPPDPAVSPWRPPSGTIEGFLYLQVETQSLKAILQEREMLNNLDTLSSLKLGSSALPVTTTHVEFEMKWRLFLEGKTDLFIRNGEEFGKAAKALVPSGDPDSRQMGFAVLGSDGPIDPARFYDWMRDFVQEETAIDALLELMPNLGPLIDPNISTQDLINISTEEILPFNELQQAKQRLGLTRGQWRLIGEYQKALFRHRLLKRTGHAPTDSTAPYFAYNDLDWRNIFQLEAVVEYYANFPEPRNSNASPLEPKLTDGTVNPDYIQLDLLPLAGEEATVQSTNRVTLTGDADLAKLICDKDLLYLQHDSARPGRLYRILAVDIAQKQLILDGQPDISPNPTSPWRVRSKPTLVLIDSFGPRLQGQHAELLQSSPDIKVKLDQSADLEKLNKHGFDTIYFQADTAGNQRPRTYSILDFDNFAKTVTLPNAPDFGGGLSTWGIPAGIGGKLPSLSYRLNGNNTRGWDHYDGLLFIVDQGRVDSKFRWTSYTSHNYPAPANNPNQLRSSIAGNSRYSLSSYKSGEAYRNFSFKVVDEPGDLHGQNARVVSGNPNQIVLDGQGDLQYLKADGPVSLHDDIVLFTDSHRSDKTYRIDHVDAYSRTLTLHDSPQLDHGFSGWRIPFNFNFPYDGVRKNLFYFESIVREDSPAAGQRPANNGAGKTEIRLHYGNPDANGTGSAGCSVSPNYFDMRNRLIELFQAEWAELNGPNTFDPQIDTVYALRDLPGNIRGFNRIGAANWFNKIYATLWLIRPDERHSP